MLPLQQQRPLIGDGLRLRDSCTVGDKFFSMHAPLPQGSTYRSTVGGEGLRALEAVSICKEEFANPPYRLGACKPSPPPLSHWERGLIGLEGFGAGLACPKGQPRLCVGDLTRLIARPRSYKRFGGPQGSPKRFQIKTSFSTAEATAPISLSKGANFTS